MIWVAESGADFPLLSTALDAIGDTLPPATVDEPYLIRIAPGTYQEPTTVMLKDNVNVVGSGRNSTVITCACETAPGVTVTAGSLGGGSITATLRHLTVENVGTLNTIAIEIIGEPGGTVLIQDVEARASGGTSNTAIKTGFGASPELDRVHAEATGPFAVGIENRASSPTMTHVTAQATGGTTTCKGIWNVASSSPKMSDIDAAASGCDNATGVRNESGSSPTMTDVIATADDATNHATGVYNHSSHPTMVDVTASAANAQNCYGVWNHESSPLLHNVRAEALDGTVVNIGVHNYGSSPTMSFVEAAAMGGNNNYGVSNNDGTFTSMSSVTATAVGGSGFNYGVKNSGTSSAEVRGSAISGATNSINNYSSSSAAVADSLLEGPVTGSGFTCVGAYTEAYVALDTSCQPIPPPP